LPEALARSQNDSVLSRSARTATRKGGGFIQMALRPLLSRPSRTIAGATLAAVMTGIVVNALLMQKERHSAPFFAAPKPATTVAEPPVRPAPAVAESEPVAAQPPARPVELKAAVDPAPMPPPRAGDPIRDLLRADPAKDSTHLTMAAQNALIKLGYVLKADGVVGASTEQAIQQFEHGHGLAASSEITPRLVKQLNAALAAATR
jgi:Putative peptidoglycan binding domain